MSILVDLFHIYIFLAFCLKFMDKVTLYNIEIFDYNRVDGLFSRLEPCNSENDLQRKRTYIRQLVS